MTTFMLAGIWERGAGFVTACVRLQQRTAVPGMPRS